MPAAVAAPGFVLAGCDIDVPARMPMPVVESVAPGAQPRTVLVRTAGQDVVVGADARLLGTGVTASEPIRTRDCVATDCVRVARTSLGVEQSQGGVYRTV